MKKNIILKSVSFFWRLWTDLCTHPDTVLYTHHRLIYIYQFSEWILWSCIACSSSYLWLLGNFPFYMFYIPIYIKLEMSQKPQIYPDKVGPIQSLHIQNSWSMQINLDFPHKYQVCQPFSQFWCQSPFSWINANLLLVRFALFHGKGSWHIDIVNSGRRWKRKGVYPFFDADHLSHGSMQTRWWYATIWNKLVQVARHLTHIWKSCRNWVQSKIWGFVQSAFSSTFGVIGWINGR